jgi:acyl-CoA reductase-like NAD-dependent aldehyde dehydrogenase
MLLTTSRQFFNKATTTTTLSFVSSFSYSKRNSNTWTKIDGSKEIPLFPKRDELLRETLSKLNLLNENPGICPSIDSLKNNTPQIDRLDPTTGKLLAKMQNATWEQTDAILKKSHEAHRQWRKLSGNKRVQIILEMNSEFESLLEPLANLETFEIGKIPSESKGEMIEIFDVAKVVEQRAAEVGGNQPYFTRQYDSSDPKRRELNWKGEERQLPLGIVGKMTAFNFPYAVFGWGAFPALAAGNSVILKPHPDSSLTSMALVRIMNNVAKKHGFDGLVSMVAMSDWELTQKLWKDPRISMWEVTGSESMGKAFLSNVYPSFRRTLLELGGNNAVIIHEDANLERAIESCLFGSTGTAGQRCTSTRMVYVHEKLYDKVLEGMVDGYRNKLRIGDPFQPGVNVGPVHHKRQLDTFTKALNIYKSASSKLVAGGKIISGNFVEPALFVAPGLGYEPIKEEYFSPIVHIVKYGANQLDQVIEEINSTGYGLSGGVFTASEQTFRKCVDEIRVGILNMNYGSSGAEAGENFGGEGKTGNGRMLGPQMFHHYTRYINSMKSPIDSEVVHAQGVKV